MSAPILRLSAWQRPVFLLNSRLSRFTAAPFRGAPLIPKLRGHFAEFLNEGYPARLRILSLPTCVGFQYGRPGNCTLRCARGFSRQRGTHPVRYSNFPPHRASELPGGFASRGFLCAWTGTNTRPGAPNCVTPSLSKAVQECPPVVHRLRQRPRLRSRLTLSGRALPRKP